MWNVYKKLLQSAYDTISSAERLTANQKKKALEFYFRVAEEIISTQDEEYRKLFYEYEQLLKTRRILYG